MSADVVAAPTQDARHALGRVVALSDADLDWVRSQLTAETIRRRKAQEAP